MAQTHQRMVDPGHCGGFLSGGLTPGAMQQSSRAPGRSPARLTPCGVRYADHRAPRWGHPGTAERTEPSGRTGIRRRSTSRYEGSPALQTTVMVRKRCLTPPNVRTQSDPWGAGIVRSIGHDSLRSHPAASLGHLAADDVRRLTQWNDTAHPYPEHATVEELFDIQATRTPDRTALIYRDERGHVRGASAAVQPTRAPPDRDGVSAETPVGVAMHRSPEAVMAMLAIIKAGGGLPAARPGSTPTTASR